ncbi:low choriolytic enzyme-like [Xiphophorus maculatus]|uniref:Metalloendopeptidase n=1 Tax=Xiphophorus maculatus TaxID=8083 RepID=M4AU81_XIPMA|nr:low choriolytic enzyme-like [Xiphophorus maculatus]XP_023187889.1 low choriolytic enzyme-like [Xiphophorus maculatus]
MTPNVSCLLFLLMADMSLSAPAKNQDPVDKSDNILEVVPRPKVQFLPETFILQGDIAVPKATSRNADSCTLKGCKWPKRGSYVRVPYYISTNYTQEERNVILEGLKSFEQTTCIRFVPYRNKDRDFIYFDSKDGCWSYLGRQKRRQFISLNKDGCLSRRTVQHEVLHALGFNHEQVRSDRDRYVLIYHQNIKPGKENNFQKKVTNNLGTPYDFKSVMQYGRYAFSKNGLPTIVAKSDSKWDWGRATEMSVNDIARVNKLYKCK